MAWIIEISIPKLIILKDQMASQFENMLEDYKILSEFT